MDKRREANRIVKEKICGALLRLMRERSYSEITVTEIIREAGVARVSFYRNFGTKEDVVRYRLNQTVKDYLAPAPAPGRLRTYDGILRFWKLFAERKELLTAHYSEELTQVLLDFLAKAGGQTDNGGESREDYYAAAYLGALFHMLRKWLRGGCKESPQATTELFCGIWNPKALPAGG